MFRRSFLQVAVSLLSGVETLLKLTEPEQPKFRNLNPPGGAHGPVGKLPSGLSIQIDGCVVLIRGNPEDVRVFCETYQTYLWPEWRTHRNDLARRQMSRMEPSWEAGIGGVSIAGKTARAAFEATLAIWPSPIVIVPENKTDGLRG